MELRIDNEPMDEPEVMDDGVTEGLGLMAAIEKYREFVPDVHFELIPIKDLVSNQQYQRKLSLRHVDNAAAEFNVYEINPVKVSRRDGINYVFDGQHTAEIVAKESGSRDTPVWCMVYDGLDYKLEAYVFANQKKFARTLTPYEIFMANVEAEEETELTIKALAESYSLTITNKSKTNGGLCAISALEFIFRKYGYHILDQTLYITVSTWEGDPVSLCATRLNYEVLSETVTCFRQSESPTSAIPVNWKNGIEADYAARHRR